MYLGYNTNGLAHHRLASAIRLLADLGYRGVAITLDHGALDPFSPTLRHDLKEIRKLLDALDMRSVVETGARFLLDDRVKHEPTLLTADGNARARRIDFLCRSIEIAAELQSDCVSLWSGILRDEASEEQAFERLVAGLEPVLDYAAKYDMPLGFEPEPGMFIDTMTRYDRLLDLIDAPHFRLTLDLGHLHCLGETPIDAYIRRYADRMVNIHIEDMRRGVHEHLPLGAGEIDFGPIMSALVEIEYQGGVFVELSRHSAEGPIQAERSLRFLNALREDDES